MTRRDDSKPDETPRHGTLVSRNPRVRRRPREAWAQRDRGAVERGSQTQRQEQTGRDSVTYWVFLFQVGTNKGTPPQTKKTMIQNRNRPVKTETDSSA